MNITLRKTPDTYLILIPNVFITFLEMLFSKNNITNQLNIRTLTPDEWLDADNEIVFENVEYFDKYYAPSYWETDIDVDDVKELFSMAEALIDPIAPTILGEPFLFENIDFESINIIVA